MSRPFISPITIEELKVVDFEFKVNPKGPTGDLKMDLTLESPPAIVALDEEKGRYRSDVGLKVDVSLSDDSDQRMSSSIQMIAAVTVPRDIGNEKRAGEYLKLNGVSMLYAHARTCFMTIAGLTPMANFILPPIDPMAYIRSIAEQDELK